MSKLNFWQLEGRPLEDTISSTQGRNPSRVGLCALRSHSFDRQANAANPGSNRISTHATIVPHHTSDSHSRPHSLNIRKEGFALLLPHIGLHFFKYDLSLRSLQTDSDSSRGSAFLYRPDFYVDLEKVVSRPGVQNS